MLTRILIANYRCFEQPLTLELSSLALLLGPNGVGKSTLFEVLWNIRRLVVSGENASEVFPEEKKTRWRRQAIQRFELSFSGPDGEYTYRLSINKAIEHEEILHEKETLYTFSKEEVYVRGDSGARVFPAGNKTSPLSNLPSHARSRRLDWVTECIARIWVVRPVPPILHQFTDAPRDDVLLPDLSNFASWLLAMHKSRPKKIGMLKKSLKIVLDGFVNYNFAPLGRKTNVLMFIFASPHRRSTDVIFTFEELSEGQRALVVLYALLHATPDHSVLCVDEPEEFLSPREIQPWLNLLMEKIDAGGQAILISHNPGLIDLLAPSNGLLLTRPEGGSVRAAPISPDDEGGLAVSERLARGWIE